jgi:parvulin-like peptidyl-prolyl isomerase
MRTLRAIGAAALMLGGAARAADVVDGVAAIVNDKVITYSEVREYVQPVVMQLRRQYTGDELMEKVRAAQMDALNNLIQRTLIIQEFRTKGFKMPEKIVDNELNNVILQDFSGDRASFVRTLETENLTLSRYREQLEERMIVQAMLARRTQQNVVVSPYKIEKYYEEHHDDFRMDDQIKLRMIFVTRGTPDTPPSAEPATETNETVAASTEPATSPAVDPRRTLAGEIVAKLDEGATFEELARVYSEAKEAKSGGDWGWVGRDTLRKELNEVAFTLKPGAHSGVIETPEGYYILQVNDVKVAHIKPLPEVRDEIEKNLLTEQRVKMQEDWVKELRAKAYIRVF